MKASQLLREAKLFLVVQRNLPGICRALCQASRQRARIPYAARMRVTDHIRSLLGPYAYLEGWLIHKAGIAPSEVYRNPEKLLATRLAWVDDLILYFESKGD